MRVILLPTLVGIQEPSHGVHVEDIVEGLCIKDLLLEERSGSGT